MEAGTQYNAYMTPSRSERVKIRCYPVPGAPERRRWRSRQILGGRKVDLAIQGVNSRSPLAYHAQKA